MFAGYYEFQKMAFGFTNSLSVIHRFVNNFDEI